MEVTLIGGEAYLRDDWTEIAAALAACGIRTSMTSGGRGITPEPSVERGASGAPGAGGVGGAGGANGSG